VHLGLEPVATVAYTSNPHDLGSAVGLICDVAFPQSLSHEPQPL